jgi:hypothetical protein
MAHSNMNRAGGNTKTARETPNMGSKAREGRPRYSPNRSNARNIKKSSPVRRQDVYKKSRTKKNVRSISYEKPILSSLRGPPALSPPSGSNRRRI